MSILSLSRRTTLVSLSLLVAAACSDDPSGPANPNPPLGVQASAVNSSTIRVSFNTTAGDNSYIVQRAEGTGAFADAGTVNAPSTPGPVQFEDKSLKQSTAYRYRVAAVRGQLTSVYSGEATATTLAFGNASKDVTGDITANTTWYPDTQYVLKGFVHVTNGATLTIQAGTTIKGDFNTLGSSLFIMRGAKINAIGTAADPIVFTSSRPVGQRQPGDWGGVILVGNATISRSGSVEIEGTGTDGVTVTSGKNYPVLYSGGNTDTDDSGEMRYVRIEFAGYAPSLNNELNTLTIAAVGSGTRLSFIQSLAGLDDSFEFFGGTVSASNLVSYEAGDDHFDMSEGYRGRLQNVIAYQSTVLTPRSGAGSVASDPQGIENDGCNGTGCTNGFDSAPFTTPVVANFTLVGTNDLGTAGTSGGIGMMLRRGTGGYYVNGILARWPRAAVSVRDAATFARAGNAATPDLTTTDLAVLNTLILQSPTVFQTGTGQNAFDLAGNSIASNAGTLADIFTAVPDAPSAATNGASFDWTPKAGSAATTGGRTTFTGKLAAAAGTAVSGTAYLGAASPTGAKWWAGWTAYAKQ